MDARQSLKPREDIPILTSLRFFAAIAVVAYHYAPRAETMPQFARNAANNGYIGLSFFFLLSGFILAQNYIGHDRRLGTTPARFYTGRIARIVPVFLLTWILSAPFAISMLLKTGRGIDIPLSAIVTASMLQAWVPSLALAWNPPAWSLSAEAFFYAIFPGVGSAVFNARRAGFTLFVLWLATLVAPTVFLLKAPMLPAPESAAWFSAVSFNPVAHVASFLAGIVLNGIARHPPKWLSALPNVAADFALGLAVAPIFVDFGELSLLIHNGALLPVTGAYLVLAHRPSISSALLGAAPLVALGHASYSLYLLQHPLLCAFTHFTKTQQGITAAGFTAFTLILIAASLVVHRRFEQPARAFILGRLNDRLAREPATFSEPGKSGEAATTPASLQSPSAAP